MSADVDALVLGGGISGLAAAWWLARSGLRVEVWEREARVGGKIRTDAAQGYTCERAATLLTSGGADVDDLLAGCGLEHRALPRAAAPNRYVVSGGSLVPVPIRADQMLRSPLWSWRTKLRLLAEPLIPRGACDQETASAFVRRRLGAEFVEKALEPYVAGPLASDPDLAEARAVLPRLTALEARYGSLAIGVLAGRLAGRRDACTPPALSFEGGMETLVATLAAAPGVTTRTGACTAGLAPAGGGGFEAFSSDGTARRARHVVLAVPAEVAARLIAPLDRPASRLLAGIDYAPVSVVHLGLEHAAIRHPLDGTGVLFPRAEGTALTGCLFTSTLFPGRAPCGHALLDCYLGGARRPEVTQWDDERSVESCLRTLEPLLGIGAAPQMARVDRHRRALPLYHGRHRARLAEIRARLAAHPGLHLCGNYDGGVSVRDRISCARALAGRIAAAPAPAGRELRPTPPAPCAPLAGAAIARAAAETGP